MINSYIVKDRGLAVLLLKIRPVTLKYLMINGHYEIANTKNNCLCENYEFCKHTLTKVAQALRGELF